MCPKIRCDRESWKNLQNFLELNWTLGQDDLDYSDRHTQERAPNVWQVINNAPQVILPLSILGALFITTCIIWTNLLFNIIFMHREVYKGIVVLGLLFFPWKMVGPCSHMFDEVHKISVSPSRMQLRIINYWIRQYFVLLTFIITYMDD